jgi:hypothetical protein
LFQRLRCLLWIKSGSRAWSRQQPILKEQDIYRAQFWAAFDAFVPGTPRY